MGAMIARMYHAGANWTSEASDDIIAMQWQNLLSITEAKGLFVQQYFDQLSIDVKASGRYFQLLMDDKIRRPGEGLPSYALDPGNPYAAPPPYPTTLYSAYYNVVRLICFRQLFSVESHVVGRGMSIHSG